MTGGGSFAKRDFNAQVSLLSSRVTVVETESVHPSIVIGNPLFVSKVVTLVVCSFYQESPRYLGSDLRRMKILAYLFDSR